MKLSKQTGKKIGMVLLVIGIFLYPVFATAGSEQDPIVSLSYFNQRLAMVNDTLLQRIEALEILVANGVSGSSQSGTNDSYSKFKVVQLQSGSQLLLGDSSELIVRSGDAWIIANLYGDGLSDITDGLDLKGGVKAPLNHLLIAPRDDGRGVSCHSEVYVMVKGSYNVLQ